MLIRVFFLVLFCWSLSSYAQHSSLSADFTIKEVFPDGAIGLSRGSLRYNKLDKELTYTILFPSPQTLVLKDSSIRIFEHGNLIEEKPYPSLLEFSMFHLILTSEMKDFGLSQTPFEIVESKKEDGVVLSRWEIPYRTRAQVKAYEIALKNGNMVGIITKDEKDEILSKQVFSNYQIVDGLSVPLKAQEVRYLEEGSHKKMTTYSNVELSH